jgi:Spy/CpxP family protein refolding chaperone
MSTFISRFGRVFLFCASGALLQLPAAQAADVPSNAPAPREAAAPDAQDRAARARAANAQPPRGGFGGLNLDDQQRELLRNAARNDAEALRALNERLQAAQKEFAQAVIGEKYDEKLVREKAEAVSRIQTDITLLRTRAFATVVPTLKPEQREQLENPQLTYGIIMSGGALGGRTFAQPGGPPAIRGGGPEGAPGDRNVRRRPSPEGDQPRRQPGPNE